VKVSKQDVQKIVQTIWNQRHHAINFSKIMAEYVGDQVLFLWKHRDLINKHRLRSLLMLAIMIGVFLSLWAYHDQIKGWATLFVETYGMPALFILTWIADTTFQPIPPDVFVFGSTFGGANVLLASVIAGVASSCGGVTGYYIGRCVGPKRFRKLFGDKLMRKGREIFDKYGIYAIGVAALTPLPYSGTCWVAGIYKMSPIVVFLTSVVGRILRYIFVGWIGYMV
jgi:membrane protein YqaA with SNARE-associated domain